MTLYELNQFGYAALPTMTDEELETARIAVVNPFITNHVSHYYMLLGRDRNYYTMFTFKTQFSEDALSKELIDVAKSLGDIKSIENGTANEVLEIWVKDTNDVAHLYVLIDWSEGVIEIP